MFVLPDLPYAYDALAPTMSAATLRVHHDKHHAKYVETVNQLVGELNIRAGTLEDVVRQAKAQGQSKLLNNAGQAWNHGLFWVSMAPRPGAPDSALAAAIERDFGSHEALRERFVTEGSNHFASGWVWLAQEGGKLTVFSTHDGDSAVVREGARPLLVCDLWEHAYYLDWKNDRKSFLEAWFDKLADWGFASRQLAGQAWAYHARAPETV